MSGEVQNLSQQQSGEADEQSLLDEIVREGARRMLVAAPETEVGRGGCGDG